MKVATIFQRIFLLFFIALLASCVTPQPRQDMAQSYERESAPLYTKQQLAQMLAPIALYPDALLSQMSDFIRAVRTREPPKVDGAGGLDALRTAVRVVEAMPPLYELG